jgi:hypothetical protein
MSAFLTPLKLDDDGDGIVMTLDADLVYQSDLLGKTITVPRQFATDFASIPRILWNILPQHGPYDRACVVHDHLYRAGGVTQEQADNVLREAMKVCGCSWWQTFVIFRGVRIGGHVPFNRYREAEKAQAA